MSEAILKDKQYYKFCIYGFLKNLRFFDPFILLFFREMGLSFLEIGTLFSIREIATNLLEIPTGIAADTYGRRRAMIFSFSAYILSFLVFYFLPRYSAYAIAMILFAMGEAFRTGTHKAMILTYLRQTNQLKFKVAYYGHTRACSERGAALSSLIAAALVLYSGSYRIIFLASVVPYLAGLLLMISYPAELDGLEPKRKSVRLLRDSRNQIVATIKSFIGIFSNLGFLRTLFNSSSFDAVFKTVKDYIQPVLQSLALALPILVSLSADRRVAILTGLIYFLLYFLAAFASSGAGGIEKRIRSLALSVNITYLVGGLLVLATGGLLYATLKIPAVVLFILLYTLMNLRRPLTVGYVSEQISEQVMASGLSGESQVKTILVALLAPLVGYLADTVGIGPALGSAGLLLLIVFPLLRIRTAPRSQRQN
ncbi:MAG: MFS transporter [Spirochaetaceae bacterium]|nr:MAG: MFS transporter [Spirochaetaceae bacterium]